MKRDYIVIHHSLTRDGYTVSWDDIERFHVKTRGWRDIGYHYGVEAADGTTVALVGRPEFAEGAACRELDMNRQGLHVCVVGNYDLWRPEPETLRVLARRVIVPLMVRHGIPLKNVLGHREVGLMDGWDWELGQYKSCPGRLFDMDELRAQVAGVWPIGV